MSVQGQKSKYPNQQATSALTPTPDVTCVIAKPAGRALAAAIAALKRGGLFGEFPIGAALDHEGQPQ
jgi:hypothetical protein